MLKQETSSEEQPAAKVRVTPEELAAAITRLEARKDAVQRQTDGTIPIGEAVQQLGLDLTPEAILAEVQAGHSLTPKRRNATRDRLWLLCALGLALFGGAVVLHSGQPREDTPASPAAALVSPMADRPKHIQLDPNLLVSDATGKLVMLSEVGDNQPVHCRYDDGSFQQYSPENAQQLWELIKHDGKVYVRGRMLKMSPKVFLSEGADITTVNNDPGFAAPITLPVSGFDVVPGAGSSIQFHAVNIHLDKHAWEKRQP